MASKKRPIDISDDEGEGACGQGGLVTQFQSSLDVSFEVHTRKRISCESGIECAPPIDANRLCPSFPSSSFSPQNPTTKTPFASNIIPTRSGRLSSPLRALSSLPGVTSRALGIGVNKPSLTPLAKDTTCAREIQESPPPAKATRSPQSSFSLKVTSSGPTKRRRPLPSLKTSYIPQYFPSKETELHPSPQIYVDLTSMDSDDESLAYPVDLDCKPCTILSGQHVQADKVDSFAFLHVSKPVETSGDSLEVVHVTVSSEEKKKKKKILLQEPKQISAQETLPQLVLPNPEQHPSAVARHVFPPARHVISSLPNEPSTRYLSMVDYSPANVSWTFPPLVNNGNNCYINAATVKFLCNPVIRTALSFSRLRLRFLSGKEHSVSVCRALANILDVDPGVPYYPQEVIELLNSMSCGDVCRFPAGTQGDMSEVEIFFRERLFDVFSDKKSSFNQIQDTESEVKIRASYSEHLINQFDIRLYLKKKCVEPHCSGSIQSFNCSTELKLSLSRYDGLSSVHLSTILSDMSLQHEMEAHCETCNLLPDRNTPLTLKAHIESSHITALPSVVTIDFVRFGFAGSTHKIHLPIHFPSDIILKARTPPNEQIVAARYIVTAVGCHVGNTWNEGHCFCWVRTDQGWREHNDDHISETTDSPRMDPSVPYSLTLIRADLLPASWTCEPYDLTTGHLSPGAQAVEECHPEPTLSTPDIIVEPDDILRSMKNALHFLTRDMHDDANKIRSILKKSPCDLPHLNKTAVLVSFLNAVRGGRTSKRFPLTLHSPELYHILSKPSVVSTLVSMAWAGKTFDPCMFPDSLCLETEEALERSDENSDGVTFKYYTRCTSRRSIADLVGDLQRLEIKYPLDHPWIAVQIADLMGLLAAGHTTARIFYHGVTTKECILREIQDSRPSVADHSLMIHWKNAIGERMEVYEWKELRVTARDRFAFRTDSSIAGIEEVLVDAGGGPVLTLNQHPGGFVSRIRPHVHLLPMYQSRFEAKQSRQASANVAALSNPTSSAMRRERIERLLDCLSMTVSKHPIVFKKGIARGSFLAAIKDIASDFLVEGDNVPRAIIRDSIPEECLAVHDKAYKSPEAGRGARNDQFLDQESQGAVNMQTGILQGGYVDCRYPMLDLWCVTIDHPDDWIILHIVVLVIWIHILQPRYVVIGAAKIMDIFLRDIPTEVLVKDQDQLRNALDMAFVDDTTQFDSKFFSDILDQPGCVLDFDDIGSKRKSSHIHGISWDKLELAEYIDIVGLIFVLRYGVSYKVTCPVYHGGSHAYLGSLRPYTIQLAQACEMVRTVIEEITSGMHVDGTYDQAMQIKRSVEVELSRSGLSDAIERIRNDVKRITTPYHSLKTYGGRRRQSSEALRKASEASSKRMAKTMRLHDGNSVKAVGSPGSIERIEQVGRIIDLNRMHINQGTLKNLIPAPKGILAGPGSIDSLIWMALCPTENVSYFRAAQGASRVYTSAHSEAVAFAQLQLSRTQEARSANSDSDSCTLSVADALSYLVQPRKSTRKPHPTVRIVTCPTVGCTFVGIVKREAAFEKRFRHACQYKKGLLLDLASLRTKLEKMKQDLLNAQATDEALSPEPSQRQLRLRWSADGEGGLWPECEHDPLVQITLSGILDGSIQHTRQGRSIGRDASGNRQEDRDEKHGRLLFAEMKIIETCKSQEHLKNILWKRHLANQTVPLSFAIRLCTPLHHEGDTQESHESFNDITELRSSSDDIVSTPTNATETSRIY